MGLAQSMVARIGVTEGSACCTTRFSTWLLVNRATRCERGRCRLRAGKN